MRNNKIYPALVRPIGWRTIARGIRLSLALGVAVHLGGCASPYYGQVKVPDTNQRLVVGHDAGPFMKAWVLEGGERQEVTIVRKDQE